MNTAFILAIIVLGALSAALGAMLAAARREAGHLRADKTAAEQARLQAEADRSKRGCAPKPNWPPCAPRPRRKSPA